MTREDKAQIIDELKVKFDNHNFFYITDAGGMTVKDVNRFRKLCFERNIEYVVVKNTLINKALVELDPAYSVFKENGVLKGFSGILFSNESGKAPAVLLKDFYKGGKKQEPVLKAASVDKSFFIGVDQLDALYNLKSKNELIGEIVGLLQSPAKNVISALQSGGNTIAGIVKTLSEKSE
jgi:large subunit ribosomal protein L10